MSRYTCSVCGFVYDEAIGIPGAGIAPGTRWEDLPDNWTCPLCGAAKSEFVKMDNGASATEPAAIPEPATTSEHAKASAIASASKRADDMAQLSPLEASILCSNLARGCEKQYKPESAALFTQLADWFKSTSEPAEQPTATKLLELAEQDLDSALPAARSAAEGAHDRGALRAITWSEKVTRIQKSLLARYESEGDAMLRDTGIWVCSICGFIFIGDNPPELCPVCKVPSWKFVKIERRAS